jgi:hypothetical protein
VRCWGGSWRSRGRHGGTEAQRDRGTKAQRHKGTEAQREGGDDPRIRLRLSRGLGGGHGQGGAPVAAALDGGPEAVAGDMQCSKTAGMELRYEVRCCRRKQQGNCPWPALRGLSGSCSWLAAAQCIRRRCRFGLRREIRFLVRTSRWNADRSTSSACEQNPSSRTSKQQRLMKVAACTFS